MINTKPSISAKARGTRVISTSWSEVSTHGDLIGDGIGAGCSNALGRDDFAKWTVAIKAKTHVFDLGAHQLMGASSLLGARGTAKTDIDPEGMVFVDGALWKALSASGRIEKGTSVLVKQVLDDPDRLLVEPGLTGNSGSDKGA